MFELHDLGKRIAIIGCSNSGKSTLAVALSQQLSLPVYHLDQYAHHTNSNWQRKTNESLVAEHEKIIKQDAWIIDGNYSICMAERFAKATSVIWLDPTPISSAWRYVLRSLRNNSNRPGRLSGAKTEFSFWLLKWILFQYKRNRLRYEKLLAQQNHLFKIHLHSFEEVKQLYSDWQLPLT